MDYAVIDGLTHCTACRQSVNPDELDSEGQSHDHVKAVLVRSGEDMTDASNQFTRLEDNALLMVSNNHEITHRTFG
jgi:hypothetical protein